MFASVTRLRAARCAGARLLSAACVAALVSAQVPAFAQAGVGQKASLAEALFREGKRLMDEGKFHEACDKFASSQREDPGLGTLLHLADCHEKEGKLASAWAEFSDATQQARKKGEADREKFADDHATALDKQLHRLLIDSVERPAGLAVTLDGEAFSLGGLGTALPLDPGDHEVVVTATGKKSWSKKVTFANGPGLDRVDIPSLANEGEPALGTAPAANQSEKSPKDVPISTKRWVGIGLGAVGVGLLAVAGIEELGAKSHQSQAFDTSIKYPPGDITGPQQQHQTAANLEEAAVIFGAAGIVALGAGIFLYATSGSSAPAKTTTGSFTFVPTVTARSGGMAAVGSF